MAKDDKAIESRQPNFFQRIQIGVQRWYVETVGELRKVTWPTRKEAWNLTLIVLAVTVAMSALLGGLDYVFNRIFAILLGAA